MNSKSFLRQPSLNLRDLEVNLPNIQGHVDEKGLQKNKKYMEHSAVFDEMVESTNKEYDLAPPPANKLVFHRQSSVRILQAPAENECTEQDDGGKTSNCKKKKKKQLIRRHSSYDVRQPESSYNHHLQMKEYLDSMEEDSKERQNFVAALLDFNMSVNMASLSDLSMMDKSPAMHYSCPVLSYMNDDEEDSIELLVYKMEHDGNSGLKKRNALCIVEEQEASWESLNDESDPILPLDDGNDSREYQIEMKPLEPDTKPRPKRRRPASCKVLSDKLAHQHPQQVLRSLGIF
mmetsp:Transcript_6309/g.10451  ORF Transcript_6309/g.10451 Transcript_6309/m.10451 type:complete len:290 (-) Transcript_6309:136-1005(-)